MFQKLSQAGVNSTPDVPPEVPGFLFHRVTLVRKAQRELLERMVEE